MRRAAVRSACAVIGLAIACWGGSARAAEPLSWNPAWPKFRPVEYAVTGVAGLASLGIYFGVRNASEPRWTGGILFDDAVRSGIRLHTRRTLGTARFTSDVAALATATWVVGLDSLAVPVVRGKPDIGAQLTLMDSEAFALATLLSNSMFKLIARARPSYVDCENDPYFDSLCHKNDTSSFPSGHATFVFTAAGLSCAHHLHLALYGNRTADVLACGGTIGFATLTASLRVFGDRHYVTDILAGALIGFGVGYGVPTLLHYGHASREPGAAEAPQTLVSSAPGVPVGPTFSGTF